MNHNHRENARSGVRCVAMVCAVGMVLSPCIAAAEDQDTAVSGYGAGGVAPSRNPSSCNGYTIIGKKKACPLEAATEYNTRTCGEIATGSWTVTAPPAHGMVSFSTVTGNVTPCPGYTFTFAEISYTWTKGNPKKVKSDYFTATWSTPDGLHSDPFTFSLTLQKKPKK